MGHNNRIWWSQVVFINQSIDKIMKTDIFKIWNSLKSLVSANKHYSKFDQSHTSKQTIELSVILISSVHCKFNNSKLSECNSKQWKWENFRSTITRTIRSVGSKEAKIDSKTTWQIIWLNTWKRTRKCERLFYSSSR